VKLVWVLNSHEFSYGIFLQGRWIMSETAVQCVLRYHEQTKHHLNRYARSLGYLDWATQPDPFRRFDGAPQISLDHPPLSPELLYDALFVQQPVSAGSLDRHAISRLFYDSLALSAWKQAPGAGRWSLRVNPSSGALHPTEGYLLAGAVEGLGSQPAVYHYSPYAHALEQRVALSGDEWASLTGGLPAGAVLVALTSIHWRESWKYGERAFRYCHHDVGHAIGAVTFAAATLGCETRLVTSIGQDALAALLGINRQHGIEAEHPDCLLAVFPRGDSYPAKPPAVDVPTDVAGTFGHQRVCRLAEPVERRPSPLASDRRSRPRDALPGGCGRCGRGNRRASVDRVARFAHRSAVARSADHPPAAQRGGHGRPDEPIRARRSTA
jgi:SagB-type dehydrogenase family enzyme